MHSQLLLGGGATPTCPSSCARLLWATSCARLLRVTSCAGLLCVTSSAGLLLVTSCAGLLWVTTCAGLLWVTSCAGLLRVTSCAGLRWVKSCGQMRQQHKPCASTSDANRLKIMCACLHKLWNLAWNLWCNNHVHSIQHRSMHKQVFADYICGWHCTIVINHYLLHTTKFSINAAIDDGYGDSTDDNEAIKKIMQL
jgi:hypothetical protein